MNNGNQNTEQTTAIPNIFDALHVLKRHKKLLAISMSTLLLIGFTIIALMPNRYRAYATLVLNEQNLNINEFQNVMTGGRSDSMSVKTEAKVLASASLIEKTIADTNLINHSEYNWAKDRNSVVNAFIGNLSIHTQNSSRAIEVAFTAKDPELAAKVANAHANAYLQSQVAFKKHQMEKLSKWFEVKVKELKADAIKKAQAVQDYRAKEGLVVGRDNKELIYQQISDVAGQLVPVEVNKYNFQAKAENATTGIGAAQSDAQFDVVNSPLIQNLKAQAAEASQTLGSLRAKYGPRHPQVVEAQKELAQINASIKNETQTILNSMNQGKESSQAQEKLLKSRLDNLNKEADNMREKMITLESLQVEADASKKILDNFLANYETVQSQVSFAWPDATLVSPAVVPTKAIAPGKKMMALLVIVFAACLSLGLVFAVELTRHGVRNFADIRRLSQKPLGILPITGNPLIAIKNSLQSTYKEAVKRIYMAGIMNSNAHAVLVTSAVPKEGRTSFTISMAHYVRSLGHSVVMVDADFFRPTLSHLNPNPQGVGLLDVLAGNADLKSALQMNNDGIFTLRAGNKSLYSPDLFQERKLAELMSSLKESYEYVLIDAGPMLAQSEAKVIAAQTDGILVVTEWLKTSQKNLTNLFATLQTVDAPILGVVMNKVDIDKYKTMSTGSDFLIPKAANAA